MKTLLTMMLIAGLNPFMIQNADTAENTTADLAGYVDPQTKMVEMAQEDYNQPKEEDAEIAQMVDDQVIASTTVNPEEEPVVIENTVEASEPVTTEEAVAAEVAVETVVEEAVVTEEIAVENTEAAVVEEAAVAYDADAEAIAAVAAEKATREGMTGRLTIPSVGVDVAVFSVSEYDGNRSQTIVDDEDSAALIPYGQQTLIADHAHQGFRKIKKSEAEVTYAYFNDGQTITTYICKTVARGSNVSTDIVDGNGNSLRNQNAGGICMYTCNSSESGLDITYTFWQPVA